MTSSEEDSSLDTDSDSSPETSSASLTDSTSSTSTSQGEAMGLENWELAQEFQLLGVNVAAAYSACDWSLVSWIQSCLRSKINPKVTLSQTQKQYLAGWGDDMLRNAGLVFVIFCRGIRYLTFCAAPGRMQWVCCWPQAPYFEPDERLYHGGIARIIFKHDSLHLPTTDFCMRFWSRRGSLGAKRAFWTQDHSGFSVRTSFSSAEIHQEEYGARTDPFMLHVSWLSLGWSVAVVVGAGCSWTWIQIVIWTACTQTFTVLGSLANRQDLKCYAVHVYIIAQTIDFLRLTY